MAAGFAVEAPLPFRPNDRTGVYASLIDLTDESEPRVPESELAFDAYYRWQWSERLWIQPEVQWIINPSGERTIGDALILGLRLGADF